MTLSAAAVSMPALNLSSLIPLAVIAGGVYLLQRSACSSGTPSRASSWGSSSRARLSGRRSPASCRHSAAGISERKPAP